MGRSKIYLGASKSYEQDLQAAVGADLAQLHAMAQGISWTILLGEKIGGNLDAQVERLVSRWGTQFAAHVAAAFARTHQGRHEAAAEHLLRARNLAKPDHPWAFIIPSVADWSAAPADQILSEVEPGRVYRVSADSSPGTLIPMVGVSTIVRVRSGELVYINPIKLDERIAEQLRGIGEVTHIVAPAKYHSDHIPLAQQQFPKARTFGVPAQRGFAKVAHIRFDGYLDDAAPLFADEIDQITLRGFEAGDVWFIDRPSRTLLITDGVFFPLQGLGDQAVSSPYSRFYTWAWGYAGRVAVPGYHVLWWHDLLAYQASLRQVLEHDFDRAASSHGPWPVIASGAKEELRRSLEWLLQLGKLDKLGYVVNFMRRHPGIVVRMLRSGAS